MIHGTTLHTSGDKGLYGTRGPYVNSNMNIVYRNNDHKDYIDLSNSNMDPFLLENNKKIDVGKEPIKVVLAKNDSNLPSFAYPSKPPFKINLE